MTATKAKEKKENTDLIKRMFEAGAHYGYKKSRRHPSTEEYVYGKKGQVELIDLEKTLEALEKAKVFAEALAEEGKMILFTSSKPEAENVLVSGADRINQPYMVGRWIGGTLTNFSEIKKRVEKLKTLKEQKEKGELEKYTKKERLLIDREIEKLEEKFGGISDMDRLPHALFVIDPKEEDTAVREANQLPIPIVALANTDCDLSSVTHPIPGNDASRASIEFFVEEIVGAYEEGKQKDANASEAQNTKHGSDDTNENNK